LKVYSWEWVLLLLSPRYFISLNNVFDAKNWHFNDFATMPQDKKNDIFHQNSLGSCLNEFGINDVEMFLDVVSLTFLEKLLNKQFTNNCHLVSLKNFNFVLDLNFSPPN